MKNRTLLEMVILVSITVIFIVMVFGVKTLVSSNELVVSRQGMEFLTALIMAFALFYGLALWRIKVLSSNLDDPYYIAERHWQMISHCMKPKYGIFNDCLPRERCRSALLKLIRNHKNAELEKIYSQIIPSETTTEDGAFEAIRALNHEWIAFLVGKKHIDPNILATDGISLKRNLAHALAREYEKHGAQEAFIKTALCLREVGVDFGATNSDDLTPIDIINTTLTEITPLTITKILDIFDPKKSNDEIVKKYGTKETDMPKDDGEETTIEELEELLEE